MDKATNLDLDQRSGSGFFQYSDAFWSDFKASLNRSLYIPNDTGGGWGGGLPKLKVRTERS